MTGHSISSLFVLSEDTAAEADDAIRDINMMFVDWAQENGSWNDCDIWVRFDPLRFIEVSQPDRRMHFCDVDFLNQGAALALVGHLFDCHVEEQTRSAAMHPSSMRQQIKSALIAGKFRKLPEFEGILQTYFSHESDEELHPWFATTMYELFNRYVYPYFSRLAKRASGSKS